MAKIRFYKNMFEDVYEDVEVELNASLREEIQKYAPENPYTSDLVECYDAETDETFFAPITQEEEDSVLITVNNQVVSPDYKMQENDLVNVVFLPTSETSAQDFWAGFLGFLGGAILGGIGGYLVAGIPGAVLGAMYGGAFGLMTGLEVSELMKQKDKGIKSGDLGQELKKLPDVRGASNTSLINNPYPYLVGRHLITPFVVGAPITYYASSGNADKYILTTEFKYSIEHYYDNISGWYGRLTSLYLTWTWDKVPNMKIDYDCNVTIHIDDGSWIRSKKFAVDGFSKNGTVQLLDIIPGDIFNFYMCELNINGQNKEYYYNISYPSNPEAYQNNPFVASDSYTDSFTTQTFPTGDESYISLLLCAGYGPLKLTDFKLDEHILAYNRPTKNVPDRKTLMRGVLKGNSGSSGIADSGDILDIWQNNDVQIELLQHKKGEQYNRGSIYPFTIIEQELGAQVLYIADKALEDLAPIVYKGASFPNNFKTNNVYFTEAFPLTFSIVMEAANGLYATRSVTRDDVSSIEYSEIPIYYCVQWRPYNQNNSSSDSTGGDFDLWNNITVFNEVDLGEVFTESKRINDLDAHSGNELTSSSRATINKKFVGKKIVNFGKMSGADSVKQMRFTATVDLKKYAAEHPDRFNFDMLTNKDLNPIKSVEVRIIRVSPSYQNELSSKGNVGPYSYSDIVSVKSLLTTLFDDEVYKNEAKKIVPVYAIPKDSDLEKFCYFAVRAKADANGYIQQSLKKISCTAEAFAPQWDINNKKWLPENVHRIVKYYGYYSKDGVDSELLNSREYRDSIINKRCNRSNDVYEVEISLEEFIQARKDRINWIPCKGGSSFSQLIKDIVLTGTPFDEKCFLPEEGKRYNDNTSASGFMLSCVGPQNGITALGYEDINTSSLGEWYENILALKDGSTDEDGKEVSIKMTANAYIFQNDKLESILEKIAATGRAVFSYDNRGKIKVIMDNPVDYPVGVISDQTCMSSQDNYLYEEMPAGFAIQFKDENDSFEPNTLYCWADGNSYSNYKGQVVPYNFPYVTNPRQAWSLGRYLLACKLLNRVVITRKIGPEGLIYNLGDVLMVQSDTLLVGDGSGRIQEVIEDSGIIYGLISDETYSYKGELDVDGKCLQGVSIEQPRQFGNSRVTTLRLAEPGRFVELNKVKYEMKKGTTNIVLFDNPITRDDSGDGSNTVAPKYNFETGDVCLFGLIGKTSAPFKIIKIKQNDDNTFAETLVRYEEGVYKYGAKLPSFQSYATRPPVQKDPISLSDVPSNLLELNNENKGNTDLIYNKIDGLSSNRVVNLYRRSTRMLTDADLPKIPMEYNFADDTLTPGSIDDWYFDYRIAEKGEGSMYFTSATALGKDAKYSIPPEKWNPPIVFGANGANGAMGLNGLTIFMEKSALTFDSLNAEGDVKEGTIINRVHMEIDGDPVPFTIGNITDANPDVKGFEFSSYGEDVIIKVLPGTEMAKNGFILIPLHAKNVVERSYITDENGDKYVDEVGHTYGTFKQGDIDVDYKLYISYAKAEKGIQGEKGNDGEQGPSYIGYFASEKPTEIPNEETLGKPISYGSWYLNSLNGNVYEHSKNQAEYWSVIPMDYSDPRIKVCVNDMFELVENTPVLDEKFSKVITLWCKNLVANKAFIKYLSTQNIVLQEGDDGTAGTLSSSNYNDTPGQYEGFKIDTNGKAYLNDAVIRGEVNASSGNIEGNVTSKGFFLPDGALPGYTDIKSTEGYRLNSELGYFEAKKAVLNKGIEMPYIFYGEQDDTEFSSVIILDENLVPAIDTQEFLNSIITRKKSGWLDFSRKFYTNEEFEQNIFVPCIVSSLTDLPAAPSSGQIGKDLQIAGGIGRRVSSEGSVVFYISGSNYGNYATRDIIRDGKYLDNIMHDKEYSKVLYIDFTQCYETRINSLYTVAEAFYAIRGIEHRSVVYGFEPHPTTEGGWASLLINIVGLGFVEIYITTEKEPVIEGYITEVTKTIDDIYTYKFYIPATKQNFSITSDSTKKFLVNGSQVTDIKL